MGKKILLALLALCLALLLGALGVAAETENATLLGAEEDIYALLYDDGKLAFQNGSEIASGKKLLDGTEPWNLATLGLLDMTSDQKSIPWVPYRKNITAVRFQTTLAPKSTAYWFAYCGNLTEFEGIEHLKTNNVTDMGGMFLRCGVTALDLSSFDTSRVTNMRAMFGGCSSLTSLDLSGWNTSNVTDMSQMFCYWDDGYYGCTSLRELDLGGFDMSRVTNMNGMFGNCVALDNLVLPVSGISSVTSTTDMFRGCKRLTKLDLCGFDTSQVTSMYSMFNGCAGLTALDLSSFDSSKVTNMSYMFSGCAGLAALDLSSFDTSKVTNMSYMFSGCAGLAALDLSSFDTSKVTNMSYMFSGC
ncbi:MAG: BspA family leucine-rich repeat surface protein, partial [Oscillospiraceae bacterium]|nr:BspA family leucine-rich repeat surface protein [Oscillospiraceae bacterium]